MRGIYRAERDRLDGVDVLPIILDGGGVKRVQIDVSIILPAGILEGELEQVVVRVGGRGDVKFSCSDLPAQRSAS